MGSLNWASGLIPLGRLYLRPLQPYFHSLGLTDRFTPPRRSDQSVLASLLQQWQDLSFLTSGIPILPFQVEFTIFMDASNQGWGAHMGDSQISGIWAPLDHGLHINCLELKAVEAALHHWAPVLQGHQVMIATDHSTVVSYIKKQGRNQVPLLVTSGSGAFCVVRSSEHSCPSKTHPRLSKCDNRPPISSQSANTDRVESPPRNREWKFRSLGNPSSGHVCNFFKLPPSSVHVSDSGATSTVGGCSVSGLAGEVVVHVSSVSPAQQGYSETMVDTGGRSDSDSPLVAKTVMVSTPTSSLCGPSTVLSLPPRSSVSTVSEIRLGWKVVPSARMEALVRHYKAAGFSDEVSRLAAAPRRPSTNRMYDDRWLRFTRWAVGQGFDPLYPSTAQIASLFIFSFLYWPVSPDY